MSSSEERITAWLDGTLAPAEAAQFKADMERDPSLAEQVKAWQSNDALVRQAFAAPMRQEPDDALLARMGLIPPASVESPSNVVELAARRRPAAASNDNNSRHWRWALPIGGAFAASMAFALFLTGNPLGSGGQGDADQQIAAVLDTQPSRLTRTFPDGTKITPTLSFAAADGRYCREFALSGGNVSGGGIACKGSSGWKIEARSPTSAAPAGSDRIVTAGGRNDDSLDEAYARLSASDPLSADAEKKLIATAWKKSSKIEK